ncbi:four helix bundle protein [Cnuella takakiae]|uniref:Four helix bundle protein n=1 Tax=Cnuella takakiae TaxID=1302690 RepID=A0A1M5HA03_9BACT|nr:four helix bundle protein [Cnuella takakiae]OLY91059.1 hypothetical protein BUE76_03440 [Cnuella takakiae]SHG12708.1 four helix bundle protein [Cnuella takakiae]
MEEPKKLEDFEVFLLAQEIGEIVWHTVSKWPPFAKDTVGKQYVEAADSIAANIAEGYGRFHFRERRTFCFYSRGSLLETKAWTIKAQQRKLLTTGDCTNLMEKMSRYHYKLNSYIQSLSRHIQTAATNSPTK